MLDDEELNYLNEITRYRKLLEMVHLPPGLKRLTDSGWRFEWHSEAGLVAAVHPLGGKHPVVRVNLISRDGFDMDEIGLYLASVMNKH